MIDDKPKHKPQKKHTLSEVLKSLQDLIRTDLVTAPGTAPPASAVAEPRVETPPTPAEPDTFNDALDQLDDIITHNIIEPVERAKDTPPEPLLPEETLEIEWDDTDPPVSVNTETTEGSTVDVQPPAFSEPSEDTIELAAEEPQAQERQEPRTNNVVELEIIQIETKSDNAPETIDLDAPEADSNDNVIDFETGTDETEVIELASLTDEVAPDTIELPPESIAEFAEPENREEPASPTPSAPEPGVSQPANPQRELFETYVAPPEPLNPAHEAAKTVPALNTASKTSQAPKHTAAPPEPVKPAGDVAKTAPPPAASKATQTPKDTAAPKPANDQVKTAPPPVASKAKPAPMETTAAPPPPPAPSAAEPRDAAHQTAAETQAEGGHDIPSLTIDFDVTQLSATPDEATVAKIAEAPSETTQPKAPKTPRAAADAPHARRAETTAKETAKPTTHSKNAPAEPQAPAPVQQDIPVLKEVANVEAPRSAPLPSAAQARDIAIRVVARLNIERRKAGEAGLDIKTIEKLQQYLADALNKRTLNKPK